MDTYIGYRNNNIIYINEYYHGNINVNEQWLNHPTKIHQCGGG